MFFYFKWILILVLWLKKIRTQVIHFLTILCIEVYFLRIAVCHECLVQGSLISYPYDRFGSLELIQLRLNIDLTVSQNYHLQSAKNLLNISMVVLSDQYQINIWCR